MGKWLPPGRGGYRGVGATTTPKPPPGGAGVSMAAGGEGRKRLRLVNHLVDVERERDHWEAEHAALFRACMGDGAAERIAKAFGRYDDIEWRRLEPFDRQWLIAKGQAVVDMFQRLAS